MTRKVQTNHEVGAWLGARRLARSQEPQSGTREYIFFFFFRFHFSGIELEKKE